MPECFIRGSMIKYLRIPDEVLRDIYYPLYISIFHSIYPFTQAVCPLTPYAPLILINLIIF